MNYGKTEVSRKLRRISSKTEKLTSRMIFLFVKLILVAVLRRQPWIRSFEGNYRFSAGDRCGKHRAQRLCHHGL